MKNTTLKVMTLLAFSLLLTACGSTPKETPVATETEATDIRVEAAIEKEVPQLFNYSAVMRAEAINNIAPTTPGRIEEIFVEIGDFVEKGQKLVQMDATQLRQQKTQLDNLKTNFKRVDELYQVGGMSKSEWDDVKTQLEVAETIYNNLVENTQLISPISGVVTARNYDSGDLYSGNAILQVQQIKPVKLIINVSESQYTDVTKGMKVDVTVDVFKGEVFEGIVSLIYPTLDASTHTFPVEVTIPNSNTRLRPGMYSQVQFNTGDQNCVLIPDRAIVKQPGSADRYVFVLQNDGTVKYTKVTLGTRVDTYYVALSGVNVGDKIAVTSLTKLKDKTAVRVVE